MSLLRIRQIVFHNQLIFLNVVKSYMQLYVYQQLLFLASGVWSVNKRRILCWVLRCGELKYNADLKTWRIESAVSDILAADCDWIPPQPHVDLATDRCVFEYSLSWIEAIIDQVCVYVTVGATAPKFLNKIAYVIEIGLVSVNLNVECKLPWETMIYTMH